MKIDHDALVMVVDGGKMLLFRNHGDAAYPHLEVEEALAAARPRLLQSLFSVRTRGLFGEITNAQSAGYLSGLLIGNEIREALAALKDRGLAPRQATLVGAESLVELYAHALDRASIATSIAGEDCSARGLFRIAQAAQLVQRPA